MCSVENVPVEEYSMLIGTDGLSFARDNFKERSHQFAEQYKTKYKESMKTERWQPK
jgi:hypothetical protein